MPTKPTPLFVEREAYRSRRMADAAKLLPVLGIILFSLPMLWSGAGGTPFQTSYVMAYIFGVWVALALLGVVLSTYMTTQSPPTTQENGEP